MAKEKNQRLITPRGRAIYPYLNRPDTKFNEDGEYKVKLAVPAKLAEDLVQQIDALAKKAFDEAKADKKNKKVKEADLPYQYNEETDEFTFSFKMKATGKSKKTGEEWTQKPAIFDSKGKPCEAGIRVGGGSILRVSFEMIPFFTTLVGAGVSLRMRAVQVIELKEFGGGDASSHGFEAEEGFSAQDDKEPEEKDEEGDEDAADAKDGGDF